MLSHSSIAPQWLHASPRESPAAAEVLPLDMLLRFRLIERIRVAPYWQRERVQAYLKYLFPKFNFSEFTNHRALLADESTVYNGKRGGAGNVVSTLFVILDGEVPLPDGGQARDVFEDYRRRHRARYARLRSFSYVSPADSLFRGVSPLYAKPTVHMLPGHEKGFNVGLGLYCRTSILKGQMVCQFTGRIHIVSGRDEKSRNARAEEIYKKGQREDYAIRCNHALRTYIVNPLAEGDESLDARNVGALINEPSSPLNSLVEVDGREARIVGYAPSVSSTMGTRYLVEMGADRYPRWVSQLDEIAPLTAANVKWFDFPVPLNFYDPTGETKRVSGATLYRWRFNGRRDVELAYSASEMVEAFDEYSDTIENYEIHLDDPNGFPRKDYVVYLKADVYPGLDRAGVVTASRGGQGRLTVRHTIAAHTWWRLPETALVGKAKQCKSCQTKDDPFCGKCLWVPFPVIHACADIAKDQELLSLYSERDTEDRRLDRGLGCGLTDEDLRPHMMQVDAPRDALGVDVFAVASARDAFS